MLLPTTMVGSYPRPSWFTQQLAGRDVLEAFKVAPHAEAFHDATRVVIRDQEEAGLDILTDGQMWFDDYSMGIGSFLWYWLERTHGFSQEKLPHPARAKAKGRDIWALDEAGGVAVEGPITRGPVRMALIYRWAQSHTDKPIKACVGAGPVQLSTLAHFRSGPVKDRYALSRALAEIFRAEIAELVEEGCKHIQLEDLGAWMPFLSGDKDFGWVCEIVDQVMGGIPAGVERTWHFCLGNAWGNKLEGMTRGGYRAVLPHYTKVKIDKYVLDYACAEMEDVELLRQIPDDKGVAVGVIDVRSLEIEHPEQVAERVRLVLRHIDAERVTLTTDCGMKQLPRTVAIQKLRALVEGARIVRRELAH
ncbi:MAG TPA: cobalamin-independent methionine synthase II family protein [Kofleriaceae bacterium]|jgi:5-methyltetrahydropteroyltriglutamate--homocysteine methyltransferase|nr:cobalamin-independent methionine synthase II family protein [Kofleriaceae bacterium]